MKDVFEVRASFEQVLGHIGSVVVAGGAVRDYLMDRQPKDFDVFVLSDKRVFDFVKTRTEIDAALVSFPKKDVLEWHKSEPFLIATIHREPADIQIMLTPCETAEELVGTFDWNVSLFALTEGRRIIAGMQVKEICHGGTLALQRVTYPKSTLRRGFRFSERFEMKFATDDIARLCEMVGGANRTKKGAVS